MNIFMKLPEDIFRLVVSFSKSLRITSKGLVYNGATCAVGFMPQLEGPDAENMNPIPKNKQYTRHEIPSGAPSS